MTPKLCRRLPAIFILGSLSGCGLAVPRIAEIWDGPNGTKEIEFEIKRKIYCELKEASRGMATYYLTKENAQGQVVSQTRLLPDDWGFEITLSLQVDESTAVNPGVVFKTPMHAAITNFEGQFLAPGGSILSTMTYPFASNPQSYSLGLGGTLSSTATRIDKINAFWTVGYLKPPPTPRSMCAGAANPFVATGQLPSSSSPLLLQSDLGIKDWLESSMLASQYIPSVAAPAQSTAKKVADELQYQVKFVIVSNGNISPTWNLVRISNATNNPLLASGRTRIHDLLITVAPNKNSPLNQAGQIGQAINSGRPIDQLR